MLPEEYVEAVEEAVQKKRVPDALVGVKTLANEIKRLERLTEEQRQQITNLLSSSNDARAARYAFIDAAGRLGRQIAALETERCADAVVDTLFAAGVVVDDEEEQTLRRIVLTLDRD